VKGLYQSEAFKGVAAKQVPSAQNPGFRRSQAESNDAKAVHI
jgi:hypothetical protein